MNVNNSFFLEDAQNQLRYLDNVIENVKDGTSDKEKIGELFRAIHTLKGASDMMALTLIVGFLHKAEDLLDKLRTDEVVFSSDIGSIFVDLRDVLKTLIYLVKIETEPNSDIRNSMLSIDARIVNSLQNSVVPKKVEIATQKLKTILFVDDASMIRNLALKTAEAAGYNVIVAQDGYEGLEKLSSNEIDLIFSDINMPQMDGMEMVEQIRKNPKYEFLPIVMLTTEKKEELKKRGKELGVKAWLVKPFNKNKLLTVLEKLLG